mgnify:FL=1
MTRENGEQHAATPDTLATLVVPHRVARWLRLWERNAVVLRRIRSRTSLSDSFPVHSGHAGELAEHEQRRRACEPDGDDRGDCSGSTDAGSDSIADRNLARFTVANACTAAFTHSNFEWPENGPGRHL